MLSWTLDHPGHTSAHSRAFYRAEDVGSPVVIHRHYAESTVASDVRVRYVVEYSSLSLVLNSDGRFLRRVLQTENDLQIHEKFFDERVAFETVEKGLQDRC